MTEPKDGCVEEAAGPVLSEDEDRPAQGETREAKEVEMTAKVGQPAPDFEAGAYVEGGFQNVKLSDYKGKWVVLCFYPGDFTFV